ncbi:MAG: ABC transporter [Desulfobacterales bacterium]|nr:MAG: ABC transporter [Desulfobacterales bacterium]
MPSPPKNSGRPVIEIEDLCFSYGGKKVLHHIDLVIRERDFTAVVGPNGGGKTTLLKLILGLLKPARGVIRINGVPLRSPWSAGAGNTGIGYVPQQIDHNLSFPATALDVVLMGKHNPKRRFFSRNTDQDKKDAHQALERMNIAGLARRRITDLSGGQRQRVLIARALVTDPELLVLDEPTASIDTRGQIEFYHMLQELNDSLTILMVSHDLLTVASYAKSIACVNRRLHCHRMFQDSMELLSAFYSCSVEDVCPVEAVSRHLRAMPRPLFSGAPVSPRTAPAGEEPRA